eukprot:scpid106179/ scgid28901/ 
MCVWVINVGLQRANQSYHATEALAASASQAVRNAGCHRTSSPSVGKWHMRKRGTRSFAGNEQHYVSSEIFVCKQICLSTLACNISNVVRIFSRPPQPTSKF